MQTTMCSASLATRPAVFATASSVRRTRTGVRAARLVTLAEGNQSEQPAVVEEASEKSVPVPAAAAPAAIAAESFSILGAQQEAINGRAAMLGMLIAVATELSMNQSVWSQIAGKYVDHELVQQPIGAATMAFAFTVVAMTFASFAPTVFKNEGPTARSFGPFTPQAESINGRLAMLGFSGLLFVELLKGNVPMF